MFSWLIDLLIILGSLLMVFNILGFIRFARFIRKTESWNENNLILYIPIVLLVLFLLGYVMVGLFGEPDLIMAGILFGGSVFVFIMYLLLTRTTRRILASEQTQAQLHAEQEAANAKNSFLAAASHEMRTPMNVILGLSALVLKDESLRPETRNRAEKIELSARHLLRLIERMLDIHSIDSESYAIRDAAFSLREVLHEVSAIGQSRCEQKGLQWEVSLPELGPEQYCGDEGVLVQSLLSVLDNAVKFTDAPGTVRLEGELLPDEGQRRLFRFRISDTGVGMDSAFLPRLFEDFTQEDASATNRYGGSGLSLSLTRRLLEHIGGTIRAESEKGRGSCFTICVPLRYEQPSAATEEQGGQQAVSLAGRHVLVVEDIPENAELVMDILALEDVVCDHAANGQRALELFAASQPFRYDAILMDLRMPVMDGLEATRRIRALERPDAKRVPILALSANAMPNDIRQSLAAGMNEHLAKPSDTELLYAALRRHIWQAQTAKGSDAL